MSEHKSADSADFREINCCDINISVNREEKSLPHVATVAKFLDDNKRIK